MKPYERRIRKLNLNAPSDTLARRGAILVEDAFHTASLPDSAGRLLVIRRLSLGSVRSSRGAAAIALAIEERLRLLASTAVYAGDPSAGRCDVVYFHNELEPLTLLAARLARGQDTNGWFWPLVVRCFSPGMSRDGALRAMLFESTKTSASASLVEMVRTLIEQDAADRLLGALSSQGGPHLLRAVGCSMPEPVSEPTASLELTQSELSFRWLDVVARWTSNWGVEDARSVWLAAVTLIAGQPARVLDSNLGLSARRLIKRVATVETPLHRLLPDRRVRAQVKENLVRERSLSDNHDLTAVADQTNQGKASERGPSIFVGDEELAEAEGFLNTPLDSIGATATTRKSQVCLDARSSLTPAPFFTRYAGMFFLLPIMSRLGMSTLLEDDPHLIECDLPVRLLLHASLRLGIGVEDPMSGALAGLRSQEDRAPSSFVQPAIWRQGICNDGSFTVHRVEESAGERVLFDGSGRIALAWWRGKIPHAVKHMAGDLRVRRGTRLECSDGLNLLLDSWLTAVRRWSRRYARIGLRDLACRAGRISVTNTHVDAVFDHRFADVRVRKAGLDLDPGWIPWLGRVVSFHYEYGESVDG